MAASITHLVVGERVFPEISHSISPVNFGSFLMGCILVDVHAFHPIDRRVTHFVGRVEEDGEAAYRSSCENFLKQLDGLLCRPWPELDGAGQAFVAGYLCHLAADECWKKLGKTLFDRLGITTWRDFPVPPDACLTAFDYRCFPRLANPAEVIAALKTAQIPDVFRHVSRETFQSQWRIIQEYVFAGGTGEAHLAMLVKAGKPLAEIESARAIYSGRWEDTLAFTDRTIGGVEPFLTEAEGRSLEVLPKLYHH